MSGVNGAGGLDKIKRSTITSTIEWLRGHVTEEVTDRLIQKAKEKVRPKLPWWAKPLLSLSGKILDNLLPEVALDALEEALLEVKGTD